jgi:inner membrane protein
MASLGHVAVGLLVGRVYGGQRPRDVARAMVAFSGLALLPDLDWVGVSLGVPNTGASGHRGYTHSALFAASVGLLAGLISRAGGPEGGGARAAAAARGRALWTGFLVFLAVVSHAALDSLCTNSRGVPLFWPLSDARVLAPWRPIPGAPTGLEFLSREGAAVATIELLFFLPVLVAALIPRRTRPLVPLTAREAAWQTFAMAAVVVGALVLAEAWLTHTPVVALIQFYVAPELASRL